MSDNIELNEGFDGNTTVKINGEFLRHSFKLGKVAYYWGGKIDATKALLKYLEHKNIIPPKNGS